MEKRGYKDREKGAYQRLLEYEVQQYLQEQTRESLGPPFGRAAPLKLYNLTDSGREGLTTPPASLKYLSFDCPRTGELSSARSLEETPHSHRAARGLKLQPLTARSLQSRGQPFQQFPATNKPLIHSSSETLIGETEYQFTTPSNSEVASFNPFQRPSADNYFFPPDMFLDEDYVSLAKEMPMPGQGKWKCSDGSTLWKPCTVLSYSEESRCFEVQWTESRARKFLPRWNLLLGDETVEDFEGRMQQVKALRMNHEGFVRYFGRFELALAGTTLKKTSAFVLSERTILNKLSRSLAPRQEAEVRKELWELYRRCVFKFTFDAQYFYEKVQLAACPWELEYTRQTKWRDYLRGQVAGKRTFKVAQRTVLDRYLNPNNPLDGPRQRIYRMLTVIRTGNYYGHLRKLRSQKDTLTTNKLNYEFRDRFSADLRLIDSTIKQITDFLSKMLDDDQDLEPEVDKYLQIAQVILESNLQYAVKQSIQSLISLFQEYYPMLPLPGDMAKGLQHLPEDVKARHFGLPVPLCAPMGVLESTKLLKEVIEVLEADFRSGRLSRYALEKVIPPLITVSIESKVTKAALDLGKAVKLFDLHISLGDRQQRRSKLLSLPAASTTVIQVANQSSLFSKLMLKSDECSITAHEPVKASANKHILDEEVFGWMSAGVDDLNLVLTPSIEEVEYSLRTLAKAPLSNLHRIRRLQRHASEHEHIAAKNAKPLLQLALKEISSVLQFSLYAPVALLAILRHFEYLFSSNPQELFEAVVTSHIDDYAGFVQEIETISRHKDLIEANLPLALHFGMLQVHLKDFKTEAVRNAQILMDYLLSELSLEHLGILREIHTSFESLMEMLSRTPESVEELGDLQDFLHHRKDEAIIKGINAELQKVVFIYEALDRFNTAVSEEQSELWWRTKSWGGIIKKEKTRLYKRLQKLTPIFRDSVQKDIQELKIAAETLKSDITNFVTYNDIQKAEIYAAKASDIMESLGKVKSAIALANSREQRLGYLPTNFSDLAKIEEQFLVFNALWSFANEWAIAYIGWMDKPLHLINPAAVRKKFRKGKDLLSQLRVDLVENPNAMNAIEDLTSQILGFESTVPLVSNLREESLRDRHWKRIWDSLGRTSSDKPETERRETQTLRELLMAGVLKKAKSIEAITEEAKHEFEIEKIWTGIEREVRNPDITLAALPKHPEFQLLGHLSELRDSLREAFTTISYILSANRYIEPFRESLRSLGAQITSQKTMVDDLYEFQGLLEELYPIFKLQEVCEQQPRTAGQMQELLSYYARQLKSMQESHSFAVSSDGLIKTLSDAFQILRTVKEEVGKKLAEKQSLNCRLYFLTNLQLLTLMSQIAPERSVDVEALFPGIEEIVLGERAVTKIVRSQETFDLPKRVVIFMENGSPRNTEEWLADLDSSLKDFHCRRVLGQYKQFSTAGVTWESGADNEAIYIAYMAWFTRQITYALQTNNVKETLISLRDTLRRVLNCGIEVMKPSHGTPGHGVIATIVRNQFVKRDETLEKKKYNEMLAHMLISHLDLLDQIIIGDEQDFGLVWKSAFKVNATVGDSWDSLTLNIDCFDYVVPYGFEMHSLTYLQSFILTPTSERRLQHIFLTMKHGLGCLLAGSAGSEKTETLKHLALMCGRLLPICHITSTTPQEKVVKFIVGCALGGFWGCIDEIQTLPEVSLCTVLYYLRQISAAAVPNPPRVSINCYKVKPRLGFAMFSTSSAADPALPQSFHEQFRTLALSKPDLGTTAAILLQTYGFERANKHGGMIAKAMHLLETPILSLSTGVTLNLSTKANTRTLVRLVRCMIDIAMRHYINDMPYLINNSFRQIYGLGLLSSHLAILDEYLSTLFQSIHNDIVSQIKSRSVSEQIMQVISQEKVSAEDAMQLRCQHLWWLLYGARRPWVVLVGEPLSGKSEIIKLLAKVVASLHGTNFKVHRLGAAAPLELLSELYEALGNSTNAWFSSELQTNFCSESAIPGATDISPLDWIHVDAYSLPYTSDSLFTLIKSHPKADIRVIFESERLEAASPSILYEAGILFVEEAEIDQATYFLIRMQQVVPESLAPYSAVLMKMYTTVLVPVFTYIASAPVTLKLSPKGVIQQFSSLFKGFLPLLVSALKKDDETASVPLSKTNSAIVILKHSTFITKNVKDAIPKHKSILNNPRSIGANVLKYLGGMRKAGSHLKPELCLEALFLTCVMHGLGRLMVNIDGFSAMLGGVVQRQTEDFGHFLQKEIREGTSVLADLVFSMQSLSWIRIVPAVPSSPARKTSYRAQVDATPSMYDSVGVHLNIFSLDMGSQNVVVGTESCKRLSYWVDFCLSQGVDVLVYGSHQCGKTLITNTVAKEMLNSSSCALIPFNVSEFTQPQVVQESIQTAMEHYRTFNYGGLGGTRYVAILDDMNMDASYQLYDLFRFLKETGGWYGENFVKLEDLTLALVHSYSEGKSRPMWLRAVRHFFVVHKESYLDTEIAAIFRKFVESQSDEDAPETISTVIDFSLLTLIELYRELQLQHKRSEQIWCHLSISNFMLALKFLSQFDLSDDVDVETYLKVWTFMYTRFFGDQFGDPSQSTGAELQALINQNLSGLIEKLIDNKRTIQEISQEGFMLPSVSELQDAKPGLFHEFELMYEDSIANVIIEFHAGHKRCVKLYPQLLKNLHSLIFQIEHRFSVFYYFFLSAIYDIKSSCPSIIIKSASQLFLIKALVYISAETLNVKVVEFSMGEHEDSFGEHMIDSFRTVSPHHVPTEVRYAVKHIVELAMIQDKKIIILMSLFSAKQLDRPLSQKIMEICNDIITGVQLRLTGFGDIYKSFVEKFRNNSEEHKFKQYHSNEEVLQLMLDRMKMNTTIIFLVQAENEAWIRSPLHPVGILEKFKHEYRSVFNKSRIVDFDHLKPPQAFEDYLLGNPKLLKEWKLDFHNDLLLEIGEKIANLLNTDVLEEFTYESVIYCASRLIQEMDSRKQSAEKTYLKALSQISALDKAVESAPTTILSLEEEAKKVTQQLQLQKEKRSRLEAAFARELAHNYELDFQEELRQQRVTALQVYEGMKRSWVSQIAEFSYKHEEVKDAEKSIGNSAFAGVIYLFSLLLSPQESHPFPYDPDSIEPYLRKFLSQLSKKGKEIIKRLRKLEPEDIPDVQTPLNSLEVGTLSRVPRLIRAMYGALEGSQRARQAYELVLQEGSRVDEMCGTVTVRVEEKLREIRTKQTTKMGRVQEKLAKTQEKLNQLMKDIEQITVSKPKLQKLISDLKLNSENWKESLSSDNSMVMGDCILSSFLILKGMSLPKSVRDKIATFVIEVMKKYNFPCQQTTSLSSRLMGSNKTFLLECGRRGLPDSVFFHDNAAALQTVHRLKLPFPLFYDPYEIAADYIVKTEGENGLLVGKVSNDVAFERKLRENVTEGRPVLCIDPSVSLLKAILPILSWKSQHFVALMRGVDPAGIPLAIGARQVTVSPNFRLYIACRQLPNTEILQLVTLINFDAYDEDSWQAFTLRPLLRTLDEHQFQTYVAYLEKQHEQMIAIEEAEGEIIALLNNNNMDKVIVSEQLLDGFLKAWRKMRLLPLVSEEDLLKTRRSSFLVKEKSSPLLFPADTKVSPREKLHRLLSEMYDFKQTLSMCNPALKDYAVPEKLLHIMVLNSVQEYVRTIAVPVESQYEAFADCMAYRVYVRISNSLSKETQLVFTAFYSFYKDYKLAKLSREEYLEALEGIARLREGKCTQSDNSAYLQAQFPSVFSPYFSPGSPAFAFFLSRELFTDAKVPEQLPAIHKYLIYAYLRPDLLSDFMASAAHTVLGPRFSWFPKINLDMYTSDQTQVPTLFFFQEASPAPLLRYMAEARKVTLVPAQPVLDLTVKTGKAEIRRIGRSVNSIITTITENFGSSRWVVVENLHSVTGLEAEVVTKFLLYKLPEEGGDNLRIWVLFQGRPGDHPQWTNLMKQCQRVVMPEPGCIRDEMLLWHYTNTGAFFLHYRNFVSRRYWNHSALDAQESPTKRNKQVWRRISATTAIVESNEEYQPQSASSANPKDEIAFNTSLLFCILHYRAKYHTDLPFLWKRTDAKRLLEDFLACLPQDMVSKDLLNPKILALFCSLLAPQFSSYAHALIISLLKEVALSRRGVLAVKARDDCPPFTPIEYPLYQIEHISPDFNLEILLNRYPSEDHLLVTGLKHHHTVGARLALVESLLEPAAVLKSTLIGEMSVGMGLFREREKLEVAQKLVRYLAELLDILPTSVKVKSLSRENVYSNKFTKLGNSYKAALAHTKDGFKLSDMRNSILDQPPSLLDVLEALEVAEAGLCNHFLGTVRKSLVEMHQYLGYGRSTLSEYDLACLADLARNQVPEIWKALSPFVCRAAENAEEWKREIALFFSKKPNWTVIDLTRLFAPSLMLDAILRAAAVSFKKHFEVLSFSVDFAPQTASMTSKFQITVTGLCMLNAGLNPENCLLIDTAKGEEPLPCQLSPVKLPKTIRDCPYYPEGMKLLTVSKMGLKGRRQDLASQVSGLLGRRASNLVLASDYVFVPVELASPPFWLLISSLKPQGHWSKKGTLVRLKSSKA